MENLAAKKQLHHELSKVLRERLPEFLRKQRWFGGKARQIRSTEIADVIPMGRGEFQAMLLMVRVNYADSSSERYALPVVCGDQNSLPAGDELSLLTVGQQNTGASLQIADAMRVSRFQEMLLEAIRDQAVFRGEKGEVHGLQSTEFRGDYFQSELALRPKLLTGEQSNTSVIYGDCLVLKFFRRIADGINPDLEIGRFLTEKAHFAHAPELAGHLEYHAASGERATQGILQAFVPNQGDAWRYTLKSLAGFYDAVSKPVEQTPGRVAHGSGQAEERPPEFLRPILDPYLSAAALLGRRTAELHLALASDERDPAFAPEPFTMEFQEALLRSLLELTGSILRLLRAKMPQLPMEMQSAAEGLITREGEITQRFRSYLGGPLRAMRTRIHGDYHLGQVLYTGTDFVIIDFEGEPARSLAERRMKRSPLQDVAGMMRSFHYAAFAPLVGDFSKNQATSTDPKRLAAWAEAWNRWATRSFLSGYFAASDSAVYLPQDSAETKKLLELHLLEKAVYELGYELNNRPTWVGIPVKGIEQLLSH